MQEKILNSIIYPWLAMLDKDTYLFYNISHEKSNDMNYINEKFFYYSIEYFNRINI